MEEGKIAAVILAAGEGSRMGRRLKALLRIGEETFIERIVRTAREAGCERVRVVRGATEFPVPPGVEVVENPEPEYGMLASIKVGINGITGKYLGALVWPVDCPRVPVECVKEILSTARQAAIVVPTYQGKGGHPVWFAGGTFPDLNAAPLDEGARHVLRKRSDDVVRLEVAAEEVLDDVDTPDDLARLGGQMG